MWRRPYDRRLSTSMPRVAIVDYDAGNLDSVRRAVQECGGVPFVVERPDQFAEASHVILPGVGSFATGMRRLRERSLNEGLQEYVHGRGIPLLGVCLGMQLMATRGWEGTETAGLGWIEGEVQRLRPSVPTERIPHVGWNEVDVVRRSPLFLGSVSGRDFYFVHSFHLACRDEEDVIATTPYCGRFVAAIERGNLLGVQFHPEKSQRAGFQLLRNFLAL